MQPCMYSMGRTSPILKPYHQGQQDIERHQGRMQARGAFSQLHTIWTSKQYSLKINIQLYNSKVKFILLYSSGSQYNGWLKMLCRISWANKLVTYVRLQNKIWKTKTGANVLPRIGHNGGSSEDLHLTEDKED